jgi:outer membrane protein OmpA-like peptidoglycan-associated protein
MMLVTLGVCVCIFDIAYAAESAPVEASFIESFAWLREIPPPGPNQIINPAYLEKREQLAASMMLTHRQDDAWQQKWRWTYRARPLHLDARRGGRDSFLIERQMRKIPVYLTVASESEAAGVAAEAAQDTTPRAKIILNTISFDFDSSIIKTDEAVVLQKAANELKKNPGYPILIVGHTCSIGSEEYNLWLSERRATAARNFLIKEGIDAERLTAKGVGEADPIADNTTKSGRGRNRRVEFKVMQ